MNPITGEIRSFDSEAEAVAEGFTVALEEAQRLRLLQMTPEERIAWAKRPGRKERRRRERLARRGVKEIK
jgi:acyl-CoA reductase-like NAD-dependent aldehyde dehydrogenase